MRVGTFALLAAAGVCHGCASLLTSDLPAETVYWLAAPSLERTEPTRASISVHITAAPGLDTDRLLVRGPGPTLRNYAGARWADNIPEVMATLVRTALEDSGQFERVAASGGTDSVLELEIRAFFAVIESEQTPPAVEVEIRGYLECAGATLPILIVERTQATQNTLTEIVIGFQRAVNGGVLELVDRSTRGCSRVAVDSLGDGA